MASSLPKILETGISGCISNSQIITIKTYYEKSTIYKCGEIFFYGLSRKLHLSEFVWILRSSVLVVFSNFLLIDATGRSKIRSDQKRVFIALSLYLLSFFANTPFKWNSKFYKINNIFPISHKFYVFWKVQ